MMKIAELKQFILKKKEIFSLLVFGVLIAAFYGNTLQNGFVLDDKMVIVENPYVQSLNYLPKVATSCIWEYALGGCQNQTDYYRPIQTLFYILTYQISSSPWFFYLINLLCFLVAAFVIFVFTNTLTKNFFLSLATSLFFIVNPLNNEVVNWVSALPELILAIFSLLAVLFYIKYRRGSGKKDLFLSALFYFFALLSKETAIFLPLALLSVDIILFGARKKYFLQKQRLKECAFFFI